MLRSATTAPSKLKPLPGVIVKLPEPFANVLSLRVRVPGPPAKSALWVTVLPLVVNCVLNCPLSRSAPAS